MATNTHGGPEGKTLEGLVDALSDPGRRIRQDAAHEIALISEGGAEQLVPFAEQLVDALYRPEAQTRWEVLDALSRMTLVDADAVADAFDGAEASLFDDGSAMVRLSSFRFLAYLGSTSPERSDAAWGLLDEAVQCYHGDSEYHDMLKALIHFGEGDISAESKEALAERVSFDAENGSGYIRAFSAQILESCKA